MYVLEHLNVSLKIICALTLSAIVYIVSLVVIERAVFTLTLAQLIEHALIPQLVFADAQHGITRSKNSSALGQLLDYLVNET